MSYIDSMSPRERILGAILHEETDRVPVTLFGINPYLRDWRSEDATYRKLLKYTRQFQDTFAWTPVGDPNFNYFLKVNKDIHDPYIWYGVGGLGNFLSSSDDIQVNLNETRKGRSTFFEYIVSTPKGELRSVYRVDDGVASTWQIEPVLKNIKDIDKLLSLPYRQVKPDLSKTIETQIFLDDKAMVTLSVGDPLGIVASLFKYERFLFYALNNKMKIIELLDIFNERLYCIYSQIAKRIQKIIFRIWGPEYITPPSMAPKYFKEFVVKYDQKIIEMIRKSDNFSCIHCHGPLKRIIKDIANMKPDMLDPIEPPPHGDMTLADLKKEVGRDICLLGYIELEDLEFKKPKVINRKIRDTIKAGAPGGGYILGSSATPIKSIPKSVELNLIKFLVWGNKYGKYTLRNVD